MMPAPPSARSLSCWVVSRVFPETTAVRSGLLDTAISRSNEMLILELSVVHPLQKPPKVSRSGCSLDDAGIARDRGQVPVQRAGRFSANAIAPSLASFDENTGIKILFCSANMVSGLQPRDSTMIRLVAATAS